MAVSLSEALYRQDIHLFGFILLSVFFYYFLVQHQTKCPSLIIGFMIPLAHQCYIMLAWRFEFHGQYFTKFMCDSTSLAFLVHRIMYGCTSFLRVMIIFAISRTDSNTIFIDDDLRFGLLIVIGIFIGWVNYSVLRYFGFDRSSGMDHFYPEKCRKLGLVKEGAYAYFDNVQYLATFVVFSIFGIYYKSWNGLIFGLFSSLAAWLHYYCTELPDISLIYNDKKK